MSRAKSVRRHQSSISSRRSRPFITVHWDTVAQHGALFFFRGKPGLLVLLASLITPILIFSFYLPVQSWLLGALGYGLIPVALWIACFILVLRYKSVWIRRLWRVWLGSALVVAVSLGILSLFSSSGGVMETASLGGNWGQYLGGSPTPLGAFKVAVLVLLVPLLLYPRRTGPVYLSVSRKLLRAWAVALMWLGTNLARFVRYVARRWFFAQAGQGRGEPISLRMPSKAVFAVPEASPANTPYSSDELPETTKEAGLNRRGKDRVATYGWQLPSIELLSKGEDRPVSHTVFQQMAQRIEETLAEHRVEVAVEDIRTGPRVVRFGLVPGWLKKYRDSRGVKSKAGGGEDLEMSRVKVQSILMREKDMALALKTPYLRLEAPVPGESLVGLEVPNPYPRTVVLRSAAEWPAFQKIAAKGGLPVALGEDTAGQPTVADLIDLPHLLIAGATGSGKSVCINSIIASLILTVRPDRLRMLMVDPKRVELTPFNGIPHLIAPVIVETDQVLVILRAIQNEMLRRYKLMEARGVRNIEGYNKKASDLMPFLVIVIDELADLMMSAAYEAEQALVRLAQLGRATGIHLILATQRPSVNVVTGLLKANIPARIAFAVASQVDSRVILDSIGAEKLLGKGDMLLLTSDSPKPKRVQGTFVHDREIDKLVEFWKDQSGPPLPEIPLEEHPHSEPDEADYDELDLLDQARDLAERYQQLSPSVLQRRLRIGYARAVQIIDLLQDEGLIPPSPEPTARSRSRLQRP